MSFSLLPPTKDRGSHLSTPQHGPDSDLDTTTINLDQLLLSQCSYSIFSPELNVIRILSFYFSDPRTENPKVTVEFGSSVWWHNTTVYH